VCLGRAPRRLLAVSGGGATTPLLQPRRSCCRPPPGPPGLSLLRPNGLWPSALEQYAARSTRARYVQCTPPGGRGHDHLDTGAGRIIALRICISQEKTIAIRSVPRHHRIQFPPISLHRLVRHTRLERDERTRPRCRGSPSCRHRAALQRAQRRRARRRTVCALRAPCAISPSSCTTSRSLGSTRCVLVARRCDAWSVSRTIR
jgi:hypothetical protein